MLEWVWGKGNPLTLLVGMKTVQVLWRRVWKFLKKLGIELPYDSAYKGLYSQSYGFTSSYIWMWELDNVKGWEPKNWCFWTVVLEKTLESPLDCKEIKPVNRKGNQSWIFIGRTDVETEPLILWSPDAKSWLTGKELDVAKDWRQEKGMTEDEMVGWHHRLNRHESEQTLGNGEGQGSPAFCSPWGCIELDTTERLNNHHPVIPLLGIYPEETMLF